MNNTRLNIQYPPSLAQESAAPVVDGTNGGVNPSAGGLFTPGSLNMNNILFPRMNEGPAPVSSGGSDGGITSLSSGPGITLTPTTITSGAGIIALNPLTPSLTPGNYNNPVIDVDQYGRITSIHSGSAASAQTYVFQVAGQSNCMYGGASTDPLLDYTDPRILMLGTNEITGGTVNPNYLNKVVLGNAILPSSDASYASGTEGFSWGYFFARAFVEANPNATVIIVCNAIGGTALYQWMPTGSPYTPNGSAPTANLATRAVQYCNQALSLYPGSVFGGTLWLQGECDSGYFPFPEGTTTDAPEYLNAMAYLSNYFRTNINGSATNSPFIVGQMNSPWCVTNSSMKVENGGVGANDASPLGTNNSIVLNTNALAAIGTYIPYSACALNTAAVIANGSATGIHYDAAAHRAYGPVFYNAYLTALANASPASPLTVTSAPVSPSGNWLTAVNNNTTTPSLSWPHVPGAVYYAVQDNVGGSFSVSTPYATNSNVTIDGPLPSAAPNPGTVYGTSSIKFYGNFFTGSATFTVTPYNNYGPGTISNSVTLTYGSTNLLPANVSSLTTAYSTTTITANWTAVGGSTGYDCFIRPTGSGNYTLAAFVSASTTSYTFTGLTTATSYDIAILTFTALGCSPGATATVTTGTPPSPPGSFTATISGQTITVPTPASGATSYSLTINSTTVTGLTPSQVSSGYVITNSTFSLTPSTSYTAAISAVNTTGSTASSSNPISFTSAAGFTPFLTTYPGATAAYSLRQLNNLASRCIQIDGTTDIGFNADGTPNFTGLTGSHTVSRWYDQSSTSGVLNTNHMISAGSNNTLTYSGGAGVEGITFANTDTGTFTTSAPNYFGWNGSSSALCPGSAFTVQNIAGGYFCWKGTVDGGGYYCGIYAVDNLYYTKGGEFSFTASNNGYGQNDSLLRNWVVQLDGTSTESGGAMFHNPATVGTINNNGIALTANATVSGITTGSLVGTVNELILYNNQTIPLSTAQAMSTSIRTYYGITV